MKTKQITQTQFDNKLIEILSEVNAVQLLGIPGIYEILAEEYNNEIIDQIENENYENNH